MINGESLVASTASGIYQIKGTIKTVINLFAGLVITRDGDKKGEANALFNLAKIDQAENNDDALACNRQPKDTAGDR